MENMTLENLSILCNEQTFKRSDKDREFKIPVNFNVKYRECYAIQKGRLAFITEWGGYYLTVPHNDIIKKLESNGYKRVKSGIFGLKVYKGYPNQNDISRKILSILEDIYIGFIANKKISKLYGSKTFNNLIDYSVDITGEQFATSSGNRIFKQKSKTYCKSHLSGILIFATDNGKTYMTYAIPSILRGLQFYSYKVNKDNCKYLSSVCTSYIKNKKLKNKLELLKQVYNGKIAKQKL